MKKETNNHAPTIGIQSFRSAQIAGRNEILYNELIGEKHIENLHQHDFFIINLFDKGSGVHRIESKNHKVGNREVHILFPGQMHRWTLGPNTIGYQLMIEKGLFEYFSPFFRFSFTNYKNHPVIKLCRNAFAKLKYEFEAIKEDLASEHSSINLISARAAVIAAILSSQAESVIAEFKAYHNNDRLTEFNRLVEENFKKEKTVAFYAEKLNISANYLNILCKKDLKTSAIQLIHQKVANEAKNLLRDKKLTIKEITYELGFLDNSYFSNFFKNQTKMTPSEFREKANFQ